MTLWELIKSLFKTLGQWLDTERTTTREQMLWNRFCAFVVGLVFGIIVMGTMMGTMMGSMLEVTP